jgi:uncharacterized protein
MSQERHVLSPSRWTRAISEGLRSRFALRRRGDRGQSVTRTGSRRRRYVRLCRADGGPPLPVRARRCDTFLCRLRGLTFRRSLGEDEGLLFVEAVASRLGAAIHMFFVFFDIGVIWLDDAGVVVDAVVARPFRPYYAPRTAARYYLEGAPELVEQVHLGERLLIEAVEP